MARRLLNPNWKNIENALRLPFLEPMRGRISVKIDFSRRKMVSNMAFRPKIALGFLHVTEHTQ